MKLYLGSFIMGAVVGLAAAKVLEGKLPQIKIKAGSCCSGEEADDAAATAEEHLEEQEQPIETHA